MRRIEKHRKFNVGRRRMQRILFIILNTFRNKNSTSFYFCGNDLSLSKQKIARHALAFTNENRVCKNKSVISTTDML